MSAGRNAKSLLLTLVTTIVLFALFAGVSSIPALARHGYALGMGWQIQQTDDRPVGICDRPLTTKGFPLTTRRPANDPSGCLDSTNQLAVYMNFALYFAIAGIISVGLVESVRQKL